jgi:multiple sugar transport system permease protein
VTNPIACNSWRDRATAILFLFPAMAILAICILIPVILSLSLSFTHCSRFLTIHPAGLFNYKTILTSRLSIKALCNTAWFAAIFVPANIVSALSLALLLNEELPARRLIRTVCLSPIALSGIVTVSLFRFILDPDFGPLNSFLATLGFTPIHWLGNQTWAMPSIVIITLWKSCPLFSLLLLAAVQDIPPSLFEAARVDGAGSVRRFWHVTLPGIAPVLVTIISLSTIGAFRIFEPMYVLTSGGPNDSTQTIVLLAYRTAFQSGDLGQACAICCSLLAFLIVITLFSNLLSRQFRR